MGRKIMTLAMVAVLVFSVTGCGNLGEKKLVPVWVWDNVYENFAGLLVNNNGSFFTKEVNEDTLQQAIAYYNPRTTYSYSTQYDEIRVENGRLVSYNRDDDISTIFNLFTEQSNLKVNGELCENQIDNSFFLFEKEIRDDPTSIYIYSGKSLVKTKLSGIVQWSLDFKDSDSFSFYPVSMDENGKMTLLIDKNNYFNELDIFGSSFSTEQTNIQLQTKEEFWERCSLDEGIRWYDFVDKTGKKVNLFKILTLDYKTGKILKTVSVDDIQGSLVKLIDKQHVLVAGGNNTRLIDLNTGENVWEDQLKTVRAYYDVKHPETILLINGKTDSNDFIDIEFESPETKPDSNKPANENTKFSQDTDKNYELTDELTMVEKASGKILWKYKSDYGMSTEAKFIDNKFLLSFEKTTIVEINKNIVYKTVALNAATGKTLWEKECFLFDVSGNDSLNPVEIESFDSTLGKNTKKKHVILSSYSDDKRSKELVELESGKTVWKIDNPWGSQMEWMSVKDNELFFVTREGMVKFSMINGSKISECRFDRSEFGSGTIKTQESKPLKLSEKLLGKKEIATIPSSEEDFELIPVIKDGYVFVQASKKLVIYDLYTFDELYTSEILFKSCDVVDGRVYLLNGEGITKLELQDLKQ